MGEIAMKLHGLKVALFAGILFSMARDFTARAQANPQSLDLKAQAPIAAEALPSGIIAILESRGGLLFLRPGSNAFTRAKDTMGIYSPIDMIGIAQNGKETVLVSMYWASAAQISQISNGVIVEYSLAGKEMRQWHFFGHVFRGMAVDPVSQTLYLTDGSTPSIYTLDLQGSPDRAEPKFFAHIAGASSLGPISLDPASKRLFVGDFEEGIVYVLTISSRLSKPLVGSLSEPSALAFESMSRRLFIADASAKCVWEVFVDAKVAVATKFSTNSDLREPRGIAVSTGPLVWVADFRSGKVLALSPNGKTASSF